MFKSAQSASKMNNNRVKTQPLAKIQTDSVQSSWIQSGVFDLLYQSNIYIENNMNDTIMSGMWPPKVEIYKMLIHAIFYKLSLLLLLLLLLLF